MNHFEERARALVGCAFRPQGRDAGTGLDCIGLVAEVFAIPRECVPRDYRLRGGDPARIRSGMGHYFRPVSPERARAGDVLLLSVTPDQLHLAVRTDAGFVHAHAGLRRVVETPGPAPWPVLSAFRRRVRPKRGR